MKSDKEFGEDDLIEVQNLLVSAARDCVPQDRNTFVEFQANTGVEVKNLRALPKLEWHTHIISYRSLIILVNLCWVLCIF